MSVVANSAAIDVSRNEGLSSGLHKNHPRDITPYAWIRSPDGPLYSQAKCSRNQTSAKPLPPVVFFAPFSKV